MKFLVKYGLSGGFGGCEREEGEVIEAGSLAEAEDYAYEIACQEYDSYDGMYGLRSVTMIMEEDKIEDYEEAKEIWAEEREGWLDYCVKEIKE